MECANLDECVQNWESIAGDYKTLEVRMRFRPVPLTRGGDVENGCRRPPGGPLVSDGLLRNARVIRRAVVSRVPLYIPRPALSTYVGRTSVTIIIVIFPCVFGNENRTFAPTFGDNFSGFYPSPVRPGHFRDTF